MSRPCLLLTAFLVLGLASIHGGDWPQWRGLNRNANVSGFTAPDPWPKELTKKWSAPVGQGVATPALVGDSLYAFGYQDGKEAIRCIDAKTGKEHWKYDYTARAATGPASGFPAARSSPAVSDGKVIAFGVQGVLTCLDAKSGQVIWKKESTGGVPGFATCCSPLIVDGLCIVQVGGERSGGSVVAYNLADGKEKWKWASDGTKYSSPSLLAIDGRKAVIVETAGSIAAINIANGKQLWSTNFASKYNASTPMVEGQVVYYSGQSQPMRAVKFESNGDTLTGKNLWTNRDASVQYNTPVIKGETMYGLTDRDELFCIDAKSGTTHWTQRFGGSGGGGGKGGRGGYGSVVAAGDVLFALSPAGRLAVFKDDPKEYKELASYPVASGTSYAYPVVTSEGVYIKGAELVTFWSFKK